MKLAALSLAFLGNPTVAFQPLAGARSVSATTQLKATNDASLKFVCDFPYECSGVPFSPNDDVFEFLSQDDQRNCLVTAGNQRDCKEIKGVDQSIMDLWKARASDLNAAMPTDKDSVVTVKTSGINFPGLSLESNAIIGCKLIAGEEREGSDTISFPMYEFTLITDEQQVSGAPPVVWIYNKLTGANTNNEEKKSNKKAPLSLTRVVCFEKEGTLVFQTNASLVIEVAFPKFLLRILPTTKEKAEEQGSAAVTKTLKKDITAAMDTLQKQYVKWTAGVVAPSA